MKKIIALLLALVMVFALAACASSTKDTTPAADETTTPAATEDTAEAPADESKGSTEPTSDSGIVALAVIAAIAVAGAVVVKKTR